MNIEVVGRSATEHEEVYHATPRGQAAPLRSQSLTSARLYGLKDLCPVAGQNTGKGTASQETPGIVLNAGNMLSMGTLGSLKGLGLILLFVALQGVENPRPDIGQSLHGHGMALAFCSFALIVGQRPRFREGGLPSKLLQDIAQGFLGTMCPSTMALAARLSNHHLSRTNRGAKDDLSKAVEPSGDRSLSPLYWTNFWSTNDVL